jgi:hypothetical protein
VCRSNQDISPRTAQYTTREEYLYKSPPRYITSYINEFSTPAVSSTTSPILMAHFFEASSHPDWYPAIVTYSQIQYHSSSIGYQSRTSSSRFLFPPSIQHHFLSLITVHFQLGIPPGCGDGTPMKTSPAPLLSFPGGLVEFAVKFGI